MAAMGSPGRRNSDFMVRFLDEPLNIPIGTYRTAMRIASKYSMEDVQHGISKMVIEQTRSGCTTFWGEREPLQETLERLGLIFEFPMYFRKSAAKEALCSVNCTTVTTRDLTPLQNQLDVIAVVLQFTANGRKNYDIPDLFGFMSG